MVVSRIFLHENLKPWVVSWSAKIKNIETHLVPRLGPRTGAEAGAEVRGPSLGTNMGFNFLIFRTSWIPPKVFKFLCKIFLNTTKTSKPIATKGQDTQQKVRDTQPNPRYSAKNNVAICMIATFMPNLIYLYSSQIKAFTTVKKSFAWKKTSSVFILRSHI